MFCSRCGMQVEPIDNFCKNCGAGLKRSSVPGGLSGHSTAEPKQPVMPAERRLKPEVVRPASAMKPQPFSPPRERKGFGAMFLAFGLAVVMLAASALYFGRDLLREPDKREIPVVPEGPSVGVETPNSLSANEAKQSDKTARNELASAPKPQVPTSGPSNTQPPDTASKSPAKADATAPSRNAPLRSQKSPASGAGEARVSSSTPARASSAGTYETTRSTPVFDSPSDSANVVANIPGGIRVNVVGAKGEWLEVHSKRGNPPGFIRRQDTTFLGRAN